MNPAFEEICKFGVIVLSTRTTLSALAERRGLLSPLVLKCIKYHEKSMLKACVNVGDKNQGALRIPVVTSLIVVKRCRFILRNESGK